MSASSQLGRATRTSHISPCSPGEQLSSPSCKIKTAFEFFNFVKARAHTYLTRMILRTDDSHKVKDGLSFMEFVYRAPKGEKLSAYTSKNIDRFE
jgi:hypothetical protein